MFAEASPAVLHTFADGFKGEFVQDHRRMRGSVSATARDSSRMGRATRPCVRPSKKRASYRSG